MKNVNLKKFRYVHLINGWLNMDKITPHLSGSCESALLSLWVQANLRSDDPIARKIIKNIEYDFNQFQKHRLLLSFFVPHTNFIDREICSYISTHPDAVIINIGAGLDTRFFRVDNGRIHWFELDLPEIIHLRKQLFSEMNRYKTIASSAADPTWACSITPGDRPVLIIAEGVLMILSKDDVQQFFSIIDSNFPRAELLFETIGPLPKFFKNPFFKRKLTQVTSQWRPTSLDKVTKVYPRLDIITAYKNADSFHTTLTAALHNNFIIHAKFR